MIENNLIRSVIGITAQNVPGIAIVANVVYAQTSNQQTHAPFGIFLGGQFSGGLIESNEITADYLGSVASCGINVVGPSNVEISENTIFSANNAIWLADVPGVIVSENVINAKSSVGNPIYGHGILLKPLFSGGFSGGLIEKNQVTSDFKGIFVQGEPSTGAVSNIVISNNVVYQAANGIEANNAPNVVIRDNLVYSQVLNPMGGQRFGIILGFSYSGGLVENNVVYAEDTGIDIGSEVSGIKIQQNNVNAGQNGIYVFGPNNEISDNEISASGTTFVIGIRVQGVNTNIIGNLVSSSGNGINLIGANNAIIKSNIVNSAVNGVFIQYSPYSSITDNTIANNNANFGVGIYMKSSNYCGVQSNTVYNNRNGIHLENSNDNQIEFNTVYSNTVYQNNLNTGNGIALVTSSSNNEISNNLVYSNGNSGIALQGGSNGNTIDYNSVSNNGLMGIFIGASTLNTVTGNSISKNNANGISMYNSATYNLIVDNIIIENTNGISVNPNCNNNRIYSNSFVSNPTQTKSDLTQNTWDNGYPEGGNYWSDYLGIDQYSGVNQNLPGGDGLGDTPYVINSNNQDHYPIITQKTIISRIFSLRRTIESWSLPKGTENSLTVKLDNAIHQINKENENDAINMLNAFINEVQAQQSKALTNEQANYLITQAQKIIILINT